MINDVPSNPRNFSYYNENSFLPLENANILNQQINKVIE